MRRRPPRSTQSRSSAASDVYKRQGEYMDPESPEFDNYFCFGSLFGPTPIDFKFDFNGKRIRLCLNYRLGDFTQIVPFYLWNKKGEGFGQYGNDSDKQTWDRTQICLLYTSDAADDLLCVDLGGRRNIKQKNNTTQQQHSVILYIRQQHNSN